MWLLSAEGGGGGGDLLKKAQHTSMKTLLQQGVRWMEHHAQLTVIEGEINSQVYQGVFQNNVRVADCDAAGQ